MAELLRAGNTMLNLACPICNNPIFRDKEGNVFCPVCNRPVKQINDKSKYESAQKLKASEFNQNNSELNNLNKVIISKINFISKKLEEEEQLNNIEKYFEVLQRSLDLLDKIAQFTKPNYSNLNQ